MARTSGRDLMVGLFTLAGLGAVAYLSLQVGGLNYRGATGLTLVAAFDELGGLKARAPGVISGVKVGQVTNIELGEDYRARAHLDLDPALELPTDTTASIVTSGLLGDRYVELQLGGDTETLRPGDEISFTESAVILERLLGKFVHAADVGDKKESGE